MAYFSRVLGSLDPDIHIDELIDALAADGLTANFEFDTTEEPSKWTMLDILNNNGEPLAQLERNPVIAGELGEEELQEFREIIKDYKPTSAVEWLTNYFDKVKVIYAFQMLGAAFTDGNFEIVNCIRTKIWNKTVGILQADNEGFSNDEGYHILWQFSDNVSGKWSCAIINSLGEWVNFIMDLGDSKQREEFQNGNIPKNAQRI